jgi:iron(II)-dependent oxidoreductase
MDLARDLGTALESARARTDELFALVRPDAIYDRPIAERHRIVFLPGPCGGLRLEPAARPAKPDVRLVPWRVRPALRFRHRPSARANCPRDQPRDWPGVPEVAAYNRRRAGEFDAVFDRLPEQLCHMAIEHRLMHAETLAYILHNMPYEKKVAPLDSGPAAASDGRADSGATPNGRFRRRQGTSSAFRKTRASAGTTNFRRIAWTCRRSPSASIR